MPTLGLGTWQNTDHDQCVESVRTALSTGYRHVDTAQAYGNEDAVGEGIAAADVDRDDVFLATKVWIDRLDRESVLSSVEESLERLGTDYLDMLYVHWPAGSYDPAETLPAVAELVDRGRVRHAGVSNFEPEHLERATEEWSVVPFANQFECHPLLPRSELREYCRAHDVSVVAYSPLARGDVFDVPEIREVADRHGASPAQVSLAWLREKGVAAIPKATGADHVRDNWASLELDLDEGDVARIDDVDRRERQVQPDFAPDAWG